MEDEIGARVRARLKELQPPVTQAQMAAKLDLPPDAFSRSLNGRRAFTAVELVKLAEELQTSAHWFVTGEADPYAVTFAGRHTYDPDVKQYVDVDWATTKQIRNGVALAYIQAYGEDAPRPPRNRTWTATNARTRLIEIGGEHYVRDLADVVETAFGVDVVRVDDIEPDFVLSVLGREVIVVDASAYWFRENFSIAHELAHLLLGHLATLGAKACSNHAAERAANAFAAELLTPKSEFHSLPWSTMAPAAVAQYIWDSGVSTSAVRSRLSALGLTAGAAAGDALAVTTQVLIQRELPSKAREISERMRDAKQRRFPEHLITAHSKAVAEGTLPPTTLAWMLAEPVELIRDELSPKLPEADIEWLASELGLAE